MKKLSLYLLGIFYLVAGINHFWHPSFYDGLIPPYFPFHSAINYTSGAVEIMLGAFIFFGAARRIACFGIIALLIGFIPSHIYFIKLGGCVHDQLCVPVWVAWIRLLVIHPLLLWWAYSCRNVI